MICKKCNSNNDDGAKFCRVCGASLEQPQSANQSNKNVYTNNTNNVIYTNNSGVVPVYKPVSAIIAIVVSVLCCGGIFGLIFAILSLVEGSKVKNYVQQGDLQSANASLAQAKKWNMISWIVIAVFMVIMLIYCAFVFGSAIISNM